VARDSWRGGSEVDPATTGMRCDSGALPSGSRGATIREGPTGNGSERVSEDSEQVAELVEEINATWIEGRPRDLGPFLHEEIVMALPGFTGTVQGREAMVATFVNFVEKAQLYDFVQEDLQVDVIGDVAVASFAFEFSYEQQGRHFQGKGRDLWTFQRQDDTWLAVWRTMLDVTEEAVE